MTANSKDKKLPTPQNTFANQSLDLRLAGVEGLEPPTPGFGDREDQSRPILSRVD